MKGGLAQDEDWSLLCYDTEACEFYMERDWSHVDSYKFNKAPNSGEVGEAVEEYHGPGADLIGSLKAELIAGPRYTEGSHGEGPRRSPFREER